MSVLASALAFVKHGHPVLPLHYPVGTDTLVCSCGRLCGRDAAKHPYAKLAKNGVNSATLDSGVIKHWWGYVVPDANLGVSCERLVVIDVDPRHAGDETFAALEHECELPATWRVLTGGGGQHIFFSCPDGVSVKNFSFSPEGPPGPLGIGLDIRSKGGYVVGAGSRHISGRRYEWSVDHHPHDVPLAPLPDWLTERLMRTAGPSALGTHEPTASDEWAQRTQQPVTEYRNQVAGKIAYHMFRHNCDYQLVRGLMHAWNSAWCKPPLGYHELDQIVGRVAVKLAKAIEQEFD